MKEGNSWKNIISRKTERRNFRELWRFMVRKYWIENEDEKRMNDGKRS